MKVLKNIINWKKVNVCIKFKVKSYSATQQSFCIQISNIHANKKQIKDKSLNF